MPTLHDLAIIIGNSSGMVILSALAAGLAAFALLSGTAKVSRSQLPENYPADAEAKLDKYVLPFQQLDQAGKGSPQEIAQLAEQMKNQPAAHLGLTAFQKYTSATTAQPAGKNASSAGTSPQQAGAARTASANSLRPTSANPDYEKDEDADSPKTVDVSRPKQPSRRRTKS